MAKTKKTSDESPKQTKLDAEAMVDAQASLLYELIGVLEKYAAKLNAPMLLGATQGANLYISAKIIKTFEKKEGFENE